MGVGLPDEGVALGRDDPRLRALHARVTGEFDPGRLTGIEWEELRPLVDQHLAPSEA